MANEPYKVALVGMDMRSTKMLTMVFKNKLEGVCDVVHLDQAQVIMFDMDGSNSAEDWQNLQEANTGLPVIVTSLRPVEIKNTVYVRKPLNMTVLLDTIKNLCAGQSVDEVRDSVTGKGAGGFTTSSAAGSLEKRVSDVPDEVRMMKREVGRSKTGFFFNPADYLLSHIHKAIENARATAKPVKLTVSNKYFVIILPEEKNLHIYTDLLGNDLRALCIMRVDNKEMSVAVENISSAEAKAVTFKGIKSLPEYAFMWSIALHTARGRVPKGTPIDQPVYLQNWPNLTRLEAVANSSRICALWITQPRSLLHLYDALAPLPMEDIFNLYTACYYIGIAGPAVRNADVMLEAQPQQEHKQRGIFSSILKKLAGGK